MGVMRRVWVSRMAKSGFRCLERGRAGSKILDFELVLFFNEPKQRFPRIFKLRLD